MYLREMRRSGSEGKLARKRQKMRENDQRMMFEEWKKRIQ